MKDIYEKMWQQTLPLLKGDLVEADPHLFSSHDNRRGLTLLFRPPDVVLQNIVEFLLEARSIEPCQYYYPESDIHLTVLSIISCYPGFDTNHIEVEDYVQTIKEAIANIDRFRLTFSGVTASPATVMVQGFDKSGQLGRLREGLREKFKNSPIEHSIDKRYKIDTAHLSVIRFGGPLHQSGEFVRLLEKYRNRDFGSCQVDRVELVFNDWYQRKHLVRQLAVFQL